MSTSAFSATPAAAASCLPVVTNISCYQFARLYELRPLRERLIAKCKDWGLKGTILLSPEGINLFVAGPREQVDLLVADLRLIPGLEKLTPKYSESTHQPFTRMLVRLKKEIIAFGVEGIRPEERTSPKLSARELKQWLDEGRPITLLDTRNDYEVKLGTFRGALPAGIDHFRDFPEAVRKLPETMKQQPIVMFCTGGIRCEKAGPFMEQEGFEQIYQLDGGILKYFEEVGADHYDGECFVFDQRVGVDPSLRETPSALCFACQTPLSAEDQEDPRYVENVSCPYCFKTDEEARRQSIIRREDAIRAFTSPLPGSVPYDNRRPLKVPPAYDGKSLLDLLVGVFVHVPREEWLRVCELGRFITEAGEPVSGAHVVHAGEWYIRLMPGMVEPEVDAGIRILHEDEALVVLEKPAPLPMHPSGRFNRNTLQYILDAVYAPQRLRPAHRLDANTTGLIACTRTRHYANRLQTQFAESGVEKVYLARVQGVPPQDRFICEAPITEEVGAAGGRGVATPEQASLPARTEFLVRERLADGTTLLEARPITGRTNQIRVHLWHLGMPIVGDETYLPQGQMGRTQTLPVTAPPLCLHAWRLAFRHPLDGQPMAFETGLPTWAKNADSI